MPQTSQDYTNPTTPPDPLQTTITPREGTMLARGVIRAGGSHPTKSTQRAYACKREYTTSATVFKEISEEKREPDCGPKQSSGHTKGWGERDESRCKKFGIRREKVENTKLEKAPKYKGCCQYRDETKTQVSQERTIIFATVDANPKEPSEISLSANIYIYIWIVY